MIYKSDWTFQWKMQSNPDSTKQAQEVLFFKKTESNNSLPLIFIKTEVRVYQPQIHQRLDEWLNFIKHINSKISKCDKLKEYSRLG